MNFGFSEEQEQLRAEVRRFLEERCPMDEVRRIMALPGSHCPELWQEMAELGWLGLVIPEAHGGAGLSWVDLVVLLEEVGRALLPSPLLGSTLCALALRDLATLEQQERWLPGIASGESIFTPALLEASDDLSSDAIALTIEPVDGGVALRGSKLFVTDAGAASHLLVAGRQGDGVVLAVCDAGREGIRVDCAPSIDPTKPLGRVDFDGVVIPASDLLPAPDGAAVWSRLLDMAAAAVTAEAIGAAEGAHARVVEYAKTRVQFGEKIGRFQGVKHPLAEMYVDIESFKSLLYYAAWCLDEAPDEASRMVSMAKAYASDAFARLGVEAVELHGAIGYTAEYDAQLYLKRSKWVRAMYGGPDHHYDRVAASGGLEWTST